MANWDDVKRWLITNHAATEAGDEMLVSMPRPSGPSMELKVVAPQKDAPLTLRLMTRILPIEECADREAASRLLQHGTFYEDAGEYCFRATVQIKNLTPAGLAGALRHFAGTAGDVDRRLRRRAVMAELSCFSGYVD